MRNYYGQQDGASCNTKQVNMGFFARTLSWKIHFKIWGRRMAFYVTESHLIVFFLCLSQKKDLGLSE